MLPRYPFLVALSAINKRRIFDLTEDIKTVKDTIFDRARPRYNEAALVARKNPELDLYIRQSDPNQLPDNHIPPPRDTVLQRAVDMINARLHFQSENMKWSTPSQPPAEKTTVRKASPITAP